ncbi:MAG TPA: hypothetical protein DDY49_11370, partial [Paenibacillaceae bacterium]|nr:hypothetical protein [Paenibacillaceae bacterium]
MIVRVTRTKVKSMVSDCGICTVSKIVEKNCERKGDNVNIKKLSIGLVLGLTAFTGIAFASTSQATISIGQDTARGNNVYYGTGFVNMTGTCNSGNGGGGLDVSTMEVHKLWPDSTIKDVNVPVGTAKTLYKISLP